MGEGKEWEWRRKRIVVIEGRCFFPPKANSWEIGSQGCGFCPFGRVHA